MDENTPPPAPSSEPSPSGPPTVNSAVDSVQLAPNVAATLCAAFPLVGGIIFLVLEKKSPYVRFWAMQSVIFGLTVFGVGLVFWITGMMFAQIPLLGWLLNAVLWLLSIVIRLGWFALWIITIFKAYSKVEWEIPVIGKIAREQLAKGRLG